MLLSLGPGGTRWARPRFGLAHAALVAALGTASCGRVGYDLLPSSLQSGDGNGGSTDAAVDSSRGGSGGAGGAANGGRGGTNVDASPADAASGGTNSGGGNQGGRDGGGLPGSGGSSCATAVVTVSDYCTSVPHLPLPVTIDGELDCGIPLHPLAPAGWKDTSTPPTAQYAIAWRPDGLYFFVSVDDPDLAPPASGASVSDGDAVELFVDSDGRYTAPPAYDDPGTRSFAIAAPADTVVSTARGEISSPPNAGFPTQWQSTTFRAFPRAGGYTVEAFVVGADLGVVPWVLTAGDEVGLDLGIDVSLSGATSDAGRRRGRFFLSLGAVVRDAAAPDAASGATFPTDDPRAFCTPSLMP